jgi:hypothetical protein
VQEKGRRKRWKSWNAESGWDVGWCKKKMEKLLGVFGVMMVMVTIMWQDEVRRDEIEKWAWSIRAFKRWKISGLSDSSPFFSIKDLPEERNIRKSDQDQGDDQHQQDQGPDKSWVSPPRARHIPQIFLAFVSFDWASDEQDRERSEVVCGPTKGFLAWGWGWVPLEAAVLTNPSILLFVEEAQTKIRFGLSTLLGGDLEADLGSERAFRELIDEGDIQDSWSDLVLAWGKLGSIGLGDDDLVGRWSSREFDRDWARLAFVNRNRDDVQEDSRGRCRRGWPKENGVEQSLGEWLRDRRSKRDRDW